MGYLGSNRRGEGCAIFEWAGFPDDAQTITGRFSGFFVLGNHMEMHVKDRLVRECPIVLQDVVGGGSGGGEHSAGDDWQRTTEGGGGFCGEFVQVSDFLLGNDEGVAAGDGVYI